MVYLQLAMKNIEMNNRFRVILMAIAFFMAVNGLRGQENFSWWNARQNWDGVTHWSNYMIFSPYYFGPNALNVPFMEKGKVGDRGEFSTYGDLWFSKGDRTQDVGSHLYLPVVSGLIALEAWGVDAEHYAIDTDRAIERRVRHEHAGGMTVGDIYFGAVLALVRNRKGPDVAFRFVLRTASGGALYDARYTDAPGYYFDLSAGKDFRLGTNKKNYFRVYGMLGFYSWQMNLNLYRQDDAVLFGVGGDFHLNHHVFTAGIAGYWGYLGKTEMVIVNPLKPVPYRDQPVVWRISWMVHRDRWKLGLQLQGGIHDYLYSKVQGRVTYFIPDLFHEKKNL